MPYGSRQKQEQERKCAGEGEGTDQAQESSDEWESGWQGKASDVYGCSTAGHVHGRLFSSLQGTV